MNKIFGLLILVTLFLVGCSDKTAQTSKNVIIVNEGYVSLDPKSEGVMGDEGVVYKIVEIGGSVYLVYGDPYGRNAQMQYLRESTNNNKKFNIDNFIKINNK